MKGGRRALVALLGLAAVAGAAAAVPNEKLAMVTVVAEQSKPAAALTAADFTVIEGKDTLRVVEATPAKDPLSIVLLADTALPSDGRAATLEMRKALKSFVAAIHAGDPAAQIALYQVSNAALPVKDFTSNPTELEAGIDLIAAGTEPGSAMLQGVVTAARRLGDRPAPRRAIVGVSIGTAEGSSLQSTMVADSVRNSGATLWIVSVEGSSDASLTSRDTVWTRATAETGGLRQNVAQATRIESRLQTVANSLLSQYLLKIVRGGEGPMKPLKGTAGGATVLFTRWMR